MAATARALQINQYHSGDTVLLRLEGKLTVTTAGQLAAAVLPLLNSIRRTIILDLGRVRDLDASGVGELVNIHAEAHQRGSKARFIIPAGRILDMIYLANLEYALEIYPDEETATEGITAH
jgi:anti-anti-sigma factor